MPKDAESWSDIEQVLADIWRRVLDIDEIGRDDDFFEELGGTSLMAAEIFAVIEEHFGKKLPLSTLIDNSTIAWLAAVIAAETSSPREDIVVPIRAAGHRPILFCIHALDGQIMIYRNLAKHMDGDRPVYCLQYPAQSRKNIESLSVEEMAKRYLAEIKSLQSEGPYYLAGHSFGGVIAFEIALQLRENGDRVAYLGLLDSWAYGFVPLGMLFLGHLDMLRARPLSQWPGYAMRLGLRVIRRAISRPRADPEIDDPALPGNLDELRAALIEAMEAYQVKGTFDGRLTIFEANRLVMPFGLRAEKTWRGRSTLGVDVHELPAAHFEIMYEPHVAALGPIVEQSLLAAESA